MCQNRLGVVPIASFAAQGGMEIRRRLYFPVRGDARIPILRLNMRPTSRVLCTGLLKCEDFNKPVQSTILKKDDREFQNDFVLTASHHPDKHACFCGPL